MTNRFSTILAASAAALALFATGAAQASSYEVTFADGPVAGDFIATMTGSQVTGISGWITDSQIGAGIFTITGLDSFASADQLLTGSAPYVDYSGLSFATAGGGNFNFASAGGVDYLVSSQLDPQGVFQEQGVTAINPTVSAVPEPANAALLLAGVLGLGTIARRRASAR